MFKERPDAIIGRLSKNKSRT